MSPHYNDILPLSKMGPILLDFLCPLLSVVYTLRSAAHTVYHGVGHIRFVGRVVSPDLSTLLPLTPGLPYRMHYTVECAWLPVLSQQKELSSDHLNLF